MNISTESNNGGNAGIGWAKSHKNTSLVSMSFLKYFLTVIRTALIQAKFNTIFSRLHALRRLYVIARSLERYVIPVDLDYV